MYASEVEYALVRGIYLISMQVSLFLNICVYVCILCMHGRVGSAVQNEAHFACSVRLRIHYSVCVCMYIRFSAFSMYKSIHTYIYTHTYINTHTHTYTAHLWGGRVGSAVQNGAHFSCSVRIRIHCSVCVCMYIRFSAFSMYKSIHIYTYIHI